MAGISISIDKNIAKIQSIFSKWDDIVERKFVLERGGVTDGRAIYVVYIDGLCNHELIENTIIKPITLTVIIFTPPF